MGHPIDLKRDENSHFKKIWLFQILEEMKASRDENVLQNGLGIIPMDMLFWSFWGLKQKSCFQNSVHLLLFWMAAHIEIQAGSYSKAGRTRGQEQKLDKATVG